MSTSVAELTAYCRATPLSALFFFAFGISEEKLLHWALYISTNGSQHGSGYLYHITHARQGDEQYVVADDPADQQDTQQPWVYKVEVWNRSPVGTSRFRTNEFLTRLSRADEATVETVCEETEIKDDDDCISWTTRVIETLQSRHIVPEYINTDNVSLFPVDYEDGAVTLDTEDEEESSEEEHNSEENDSNYSYRRDSGSESEN